MNLAASFNSAHSIIATVAKDFEVSALHVSGPRRSAVIALPRHIAMYLIARVCRISLPAIGKIFDRDHTSVLHGIRRIERLVADDPIIASRVSALEALSQVRIESGDVEITDDLGLSQSNAVVSTVRLAKSVAGRSCSGSATAIRRVISGYFHESLVFEASERDGNRVEFHVCRSTGSWTALKVDRFDLGQIIASGLGWEKAWGRIGEAHNEDLRRESAANTSKSEKVKKRNCLTCGNPFMSEGPHIRKCDHCKRLASAQGSSLGDLA